MNKETKIENLTDGNDFKIDFYDLSHPKVKNTT